MKTLTGKTLTTECCVVIPESILTWMRFERESFGIIDEVPCATCGMTRGSLMFREYEAGTEWSGNACCGDY